jgi:hypothetical protein
MVRLCSIADSRRRRHRLTDARDGNVGLGRKKNAESLAHQGLAGCAKNAVDAHIYLRRRQSSAGSATGRVCSRLSA